MDDLRAIGPSSPWGCLLHNFINFLVKESGHGVMQCKVADRLCREPCITGEIHHGAYPELVEAGFVCISFALSFRF
jgi:hypothetical protein